MAILMIADASEQLLAHYDRVIKDLEAAGLNHPRDACPTSRRARSKTT